MRIPKKPNLKEPPYATSKEMKEWNNFIDMVFAIVSLVVSSVALIVSLLSLL